MFLLIKIALAFITMWSICLLFLFFTYSAYKVNYHLKNSSSQSAISCKRSRPPFLFLFPFLNPCSRWSDFFSMCWILSRRQQGETAQLPHQFCVSSRPDWPSSKTWRRGGEKERGDKLKTRGKKGKKGKVLVGSWRVFVRGLFQGQGAHRCRRGESTALEEECTAGRRRDILPPTPDYVCTASRVEKQCEKF